MWEGQRLRSTSADARYAHRATGPIRLPPWLAACQLGKPHAPHALVVSQPSGRGTAEGVQEASKSAGPPVMGWRGDTDPTRKGADFWLVPTLAQDVPGPNRRETFDNAGQ